MNQRASLTAASGLLPLVSWLAAYAAAQFCSAEAASRGQVISLDAEQGWVVSIDPDNVGKAARWFERPQEPRRPTRVPSTIQEVFDDYHGVAWYWREFDCPRNPDPQGRYLLQFAHVDYLGEVWINDKFVGSHEGADGVFTLDVTNAVVPGGKNQLAVRVINPADEPIEGIKLAETAHRNKTSQFTFGCDYNHGGLEGSVELLVVGAVRIEDLHVRPNVETGVILVNAEVQNALADAANVELKFTVSSARDGAALNTLSLKREVPSGAKAVSVELHVDDFRRWELDDPYLYRVSAELTRNGSSIGDGEAVRCGFRDFRISGGRFQLNGRRIFLRSSHTGNMAPIGLHLPFEKGWFLRDLIYTKAVGFNMIRFIAGYPTQEQLDLCDELGMLVYVEPYAAWMLADSPKMIERFDRSVEAMIHCDRNHPSVVVRGLLNETQDGPVFRHAVAALANVRKLDEDRVVLLNSGRFDLQHPTIGSAANPGQHEWEPLLGSDGIQPKEPPPMIYPSPQGAGDAHLYPQVPHTKEAFDLLRSYGQQGQPFFLSEYGVASGVDLVRMVRQYEQRGKASSGEARFYRDALNRFQADWDRWKLNEVFGRPEEFFAQSIERMAHERLRGINALRANPKCNGYSLTGTVDQGYSGEGLLTPFRELKTGTTDSLNDALAPLRLSTFVEPPVAYRGSKVRIEVILSNEDVLKKGTYPLRVDCVDERSHIVWTKRVEVTIPADGDESAPMVVPALEDSLSADWPSGKYRLMATFERDSAAAGGTTEISIVDAAEMPSVKSEVVLWGEDPELRQWLLGHDIRSRRFDEGQSDPKVRTVILASGRCLDPDKSESFKQLLARIRSGSKAVFLTPTLLSEDGLELPCKGKIEGLWSGVYHKEEWNRRHPAFASLPAGGLMDYDNYRDLIPNVAWMREGSPPSDPIAGAIHAAPGAGYGSGLLLFADAYGHGKYTVNLLRIRESLGANPHAERLLRNLLEWQ
jgi:hypothetical protein